MPTATKSRAKTTTTTTSPSRRARATVTAILGTLRRVLGDDYPGEKIAAGRARLDAAAEKVLAKSD